MIMRILLSFFTLRAVSFSQNPFLVLCTVNPHQKYKQSFNLNGFTKSVSDIKPKGLMLSGGCRIIFKVSKKSLEVRGT